MRNVVFLLEEPSARELLRGVLPRLLPVDVEAYFLVFEGKQDLEKQLVRKIRDWQKPNSVFVVLRDQDAAECRVVRDRLRDIAAGSGRGPVLVRVACREIESWLVGDWEAVAEAFERPHLAAQANKAVFREPDTLVRPVESLQRFLPDYQKRSGARRVGPLLVPGRNRSRSFQAFCAGIRKLVGEAEA